MNDLKRKTRINRGVLFQNNKWLLNVYIIQSNEYEKITDEEAYKVIDMFLVDIENNCLSEEFVYFRTGFVFLHYGSRGVDLNFWHVGSWGNTYELFNRSWYCYGRELDKMEVLDDAEPVLSQYELFYLRDELNMIAEVVKELPEKNLFQDYYLKSCLVFS